MSALVHLVRTPQGVCQVTLERWGLALEARGGFDAVWAAPGGVVLDDALSLEAYRLVVKAHLGAVYRAQHGTAPGSVALNLASHQLLDDLRGWAQLNWPPPGLRPH